MDDKRTLNLIDDETKINWTPFFLCINDRSANERKGEGESENNKKIIVRSLTWVLLWSYFW